MPMPYIKKQLLGIKDMPTVNDQTNVCKKKSAVRRIACEGFFLGLQTVWQKIEKEVMDLLQQLAPKFATAVFFLHRWQ